MKPIREQSGMKAVPQMALAMVFLLFISACASSTLSPGLVARMDQEGAMLDQQEAIGLINQYRASRGVSPLIADPSLSAMARELARTYAYGIRRPVRPEEGGILQMLLSAGYASFADTFSGWRGRIENAGSIADPDADRAAIAVSYSPDSEFGVYWVLLLAAPENPVGE